MAAQTQGCREIIFVFPLGLCFICSLGLLLIESFPENFPKLQRFVLGVWSGNPARGLLPVSPNVSAACPSYSAGKLCREVIEAAGDHGGHDADLPDWWRCQRYYA